jgi:hypothetical protein
MKNHVRFFLALATSATTMACAPAGNAQHFNESAMPDDTTKEVFDASVSEASVQSLANQFVVPNYSAAQKAAALAKYNHVDPSHQINDQLLENAILYFDANKAQFKNTAVMTVIDFSLNSKVKRFYMIDMVSGIVWSTYVAHGSGSDPDHDGFAQTFSNVSGSNATSLGAYLTAETYSGKHGYSLRLDGLSTTNSNVRARAIVVHGASYVADAEVIQGRSWGCPALPMIYRTKVIDAIKGGSLIYAGASKLLGSPSPNPTPKPSPMPTPKPSATPVKMPTPVPTPVSTPKPPVVSPGTFTAIWDSAPSMTAKNWTSFVEQAVLSYGQALLNGPSDVTNFCPTYASLTTQNKLNFWAQLFAGVAKYESGFDPTNRYVETTMGTDPITGKQVASEGLLQLSYQDEKNFSGVLPPGVCDFNFAADKNLASNDIRRTILDPKTNLTCGVFILNRQVSRVGKIGITSGAYWSTLRPSGSILAKIQAITKSTAFCKP